MYLSIKNKYLFNKKLSDKAIATLLIMSGLRSSFDTTIITAEQVYYYMYGTLNTTRKTLDSVKESLEEVSKVITPIECMKDMYVFCTYDLTVNSIDDDFVLIKMSEFNKLKYNIKLIRYYLVVLSTINNNTKCGFTPIDKLAEKAFINNRSAINYNKKLVELGILYIYNENRFDAKNGTQTANTYGRTEDKAKIFFNAKEYYKIRNFAIGRELSSNDGRRISKQYNDFCKGFFKGDVEQLKKDCKLYNDTFNNKKDMSVFENVEITFEKVENEQQEEVANTNTHNDDLEQKEQANDDCKYTILDGENQEEYDCEPLNYELEEFKSKKEESKEWIAKNKEYIKSNFGQDALDEFNQLGKGICKHLNFESPSDFYNWMDEFKYGLKVIFKKYKKV